MGFALGQLATYDAVTLHGQRAGATVRWVRRRRMLLGAMLGFAGKVGRLMWGRLRAEIQPVTIDRHGVVMRGIGPIPWDHLALPRKTHVRVQGDIGGETLQLFSTAHARFAPDPRLR